MATKNFLIVGFPVAFIICLIMNDLSTFDVESQINYQKTTSGHTRKLLQAPLDKFYLAECDTYPDLDKDAMLYARSGSHPVNAISYCQDISTTRRIFCVCLELLGEIIRAQDFFDPTDPHINQTVYNILDNRANSNVSIGELLRQHSRSNEATQGSCQSVISSYHDSLSSCINRYESSLASLVHSQEGEVNSSSRGTVHEGLSFDTNVPQLLPPIDLCPRRFWSDFDITGNSYGQGISGWHNLSMSEYPERTASSHLGRPNMSQYLAGLMTPSTQSSTPSIAFDSMRVIPEASDAQNYLMMGCSPAPADTYEYMAPIPNNRTNHTYQNIPLDESDDTDISSLSSYRESDYSDSSSIHDQQDGHSVNTYETIKSQQDGQSVNTYETIKSQQDGRSDNTYESIQDQQDGRSDITYESIYNPQNDSTTLQNESIDSEDESTTSQDVPHSVHYRQADPSQIDFETTSDQTRQNFNLRPTTNGFGSYWSSIPMRARNCIICLCRRRSLEMTDDL